MGHFHQISRSNGTIQLSQAIWHHMEKKKLTEKGKCFLELRNLFFSELVSHFCGDVME